MGHKFFTLLLSCAGLALMATPAAAAGTDYAGYARNIIPSGEPGGLPIPDGADTQAKMYDALTPLGGNVTADDLLKDFKSENFGVNDALPSVPETTPRAGLTIVRDSYDVPHITGVTHDDAVWGAGWVAEEDRGLLGQQARYAARFAALDAPGIDAFGLVKNLSAVTVSKQADQIINTEQTAALKSAGAAGKVLSHDIDVYLQGFNARLKAEHSPNAPWTRVDVFSINALAGQIFGQGGGDEARRTEFLNGLQKRLGDKQGLTLFNDLSEHNDPDAPVTISKSFPYEQIPATRKGNVILEDGSLSKTTQRNVAASTREQHYASNFLTVSAQRSATGHPLFVAGPQIGYYYPGLTQEIDIHAPGIDARGATVPGMSAGTILIGRNQDTSWSLTSAGSDTNDQFAETLCGGSSTKYRYKGKCLTMGRVNAGTINKKAVVYRTTVHGPVLGYGKAGGKKIAISFDRSSHGRDILWELYFRAMTNGDVKTPSDFFKAASTSPFTFNTIYADSKHLAVYSTGRLPIRAKDVDPRLLTNGDGNHEWRGFLSAAAHPHIADPSDGELVNWNNQPAPGFGPADDEWSYGITHRVQMLRAGIDAKPVHDPASVVSAMNKAATEDLPDVVLTPLLTKLLAGSTPPSPREAQMLTELQAWVTNGAAVMDRDGDGKVDDPGAAIMDDLYPHLYSAILQPALGTQFSALQSITGDQNDWQTDMTGGGIDYLVKDLSSITGATVKKPFTTRFCGGGSVAACQAAVWTAFQQTGDDLTAAQGTADPTLWHADANAERITFAPGLLKTTIAFTNRPSGIQQVIWFSGHR